jgi:prepilin-type N-terminal cleavage/methylation domain-containing protein
VLSARTLSRHSSLVTRRAAFTLLELLVVIAIIAILMVLVVPALTNLKGANDITTGAYTVKGVLEQARTYAKANNTYSWVGFYEEDGSKTSTSPATSGNGRLVMSIVASKDGTTIYKSGMPGAIDPTKLIQIGRLMKVDNSHLPLLNVGTGTGDVFDTRRAQCDSSKHCAQHKFPVPFPISSP